MKPPASASMAEIETGLEEGEEVILNPRVLLSDKDRASLGEVCGVLREEFGEYSEA